MAKVTEVVKEIAQTWQKLGKDDRQKYKEAAKRGKLKYWLKLVFIFNTQNELDPTISLYNIQRDFLAAY